MSEARVVLVKPGDVLILGNVGTGSVAQLQDLLPAFKDALSLAYVVVFEGDIDMAAVPGA